MICTEPKKRYDAGLARVVANALTELLRPFCEPERVIVAGSLRRGQLKAADQFTVGDIEILFVPKMQLRIKPGEMFESETDAAADLLNNMVKDGRLSRRLNVDGQTMWGPQNKLALHTATGLPVDFFSTTQACWWNYLVCRTGPAESNTRIAAEARKRGWMWHPYGSGFEELTPQGVQTSRMHLITSERAVFDFVGLDYQEPGER